jgi:hypothetical protein
MTSLHQDGQLDPHPTPANLRRDPYPADANGKTNRQLVDGFLRDANEDSESKSSNQIGIYRDLERNSTEYSQPPAQKTPPYASPSPMNSARCRQ